MKLKIIFKSLVIGIILSWFLIGCSSQSIVLDSSYNYSAKFKKYSSFGFLDMNGTSMTEEEEYIIQKTIFQRMTSLGYKYQPENADIYVAYKYFERPIDISGFYQIKLGNWVKDETTTQSSDQKNNRNTNYVQRKISLPAGSYVVNFLDTSLGDTVWQGYIGKQSSWDHADQLQSSIVLVMDEYKVLAYNW